MLRALRQVMRPEAFHGGGRTRGPFFEGWYFKLVDAEERSRLAVIPGLFLHEEPARSEAFVQELDGARGRSWYEAFPSSAFSASPERLDVRVGDSRFTREGLELRLPEAGIEGRIRFGGLRPWPVTLRSPGVMGWYAWVPTMECYHGIVSLDHGLQGELRVGDEKLRFDGGRGYCEKDWGEAFPSSYVWLQSNHFDAPGLCLTASIARIPWRGRSFTGFLAGLLLDGELHRFATYTGARVDQLEVEEKRVLWGFGDRRKRIRLEAERAEGSLLHAPVRTEMHRRVEETLRARVHFRFEEATRSGWRLRFEGTGRCAGLEVHGDPSELGA